MRAQAGDAPYHRKRRGQGNRLQNFLGVGKQGHGISYVIAKAVVYKGLLALKKIFQSDPVNE